jgi:predicted RNA-binding protein with PUA-like domain
MEGNRNRRRSAGLRPGPPRAASEETAAMRYFLAKTDPDTYSFDDLSRDGRTTWDGVTNPQAVAVIRSMRKGDRVLVYHSGGQAAIVGLAKVTSAPRPDPSNSKSAVVDLQFLQALDPPTSLSLIKSLGAFGDWALIRQGRLSTMAVPEDFVAWLRTRYPAVKL